jgi:plastocyanin
MKKLVPLLCACVALALIGAGCGSDKKSSSSDNGGGGASAPAESGGGGGKSAAVKMENIQFNPASVTIAPGGTVKWTNEDSVGHDVTAKDGSFKSGAPGGLSKGATFSHTFKKAGAFKYKCTVHPGMEGAVTVK